MPELPEVETVRRGLEILLRGDAVRSVTVLRADSIGAPDVETFIDKVRGHSFGAVHRRGKYLLLDLDKGAGLACHLRMSGRLIVREGKPASAATKVNSKEKDKTQTRDSAGERGRDNRKDKKAGRRSQQKEREPQFVRVIFYLKSGRELHFEDMRVFGRLWYKPRGVSFEQIIPTLAELGIEPLEGLDGEYLQRAFSNKMQPVKSALLDQRILAGVGNIYADESLFLSRVHPATAAKKLRLEQLQELSVNIKTVLDRAIISGGSTLRDYSDSSGINGNYQNQAMVYGREDEPCRRCGSLIERLKLSGRSSHYCPTCQPRPRLVKKKKAGPLVAAR